jgi:nucleoside-diphosphate-sugar epimerase
MKKVLVCGAGGFIGGHLVKKLKRQGHWVRGVDLKLHEFSPSMADEFIVGDLTDQAFVRKVLDLPFDEVYQLAADMGGAGYLFTGDNDANVMHNSALVNLNIIQQALHVGVKKLFYSSSACIYPSYNQEDPQNPKCSEDSAYPAMPDSDYGWEKLFSERLFQAFNRNYNMDVRIARFHNIFGPEGTYTGGKEKSPAAICRKVAEAQDGDGIEVWGDGLQTRSYLYIDECLEGIERLMQSDFVGPVNIGSEEMVTLNQLAEMVIGFSNKKLYIINVDVAHTGVRGRNSDNKLIKKELGWAPSKPLSEGMRKTFDWIKAQVNTGVSAMKLS